MKSFWGCGRQTLVPFRLVQFDMARSHLHGGKVVRWVGSSEVRSGEISV